jgi:hypothetical protein
MRVLCASCPRALLAQGSDEFRSTKLLANFVSMSVDTSGECQGLLKWNWAPGASLMVMPSWIVDISGFSLGFAISPSNIPSRWVKGLFCFFYGGRRWCPKLLLSCICRPRDSRMILWQQDFCLLFLSLPVWKDTVIEMRSMRWRKWLLTLYMLIW